MSNIRDYLTVQEQADYKQVATMSGQEIANKLGITRMAVSQTLKRGLKKYFLNAKKELKDMNDFEVAVAIQLALNVGDQDASAFCKLFPLDIRKKIEASAVETMKGK